MAKQISQNKERDESSAIFAPESSTDRIQADKEFLKASEKFINELGEIVESAESQELAEFVEGEISETSSEGKKKAPAASGAKGTTGTQVKREKALPSIEIMQVQVATRIQNEIRGLENEVKKLMSASGANFNPHKLNMIMARIRSLKEILAGLIYNTAEAIKGLWLKYVKGAH